MIDTKRNDIIRSYFRCYLNDLDDVYLDLWSSIFLYNHYTIHLEFV